MTAVIIDGETVSVPGLNMPDGAAEDPEIIMNQGIPRMIELLEDQDHPVWLETERRVFDASPDLIGITCNSGNMDAARLLIGRLKSHGLPIILGGSHPTVLPEQSIDYTGADMVAIGEGRTDSPECNEHSATRRRFFEDPVACLETQRPYHS